MAINYTYKPYEEDEYTRRLREAALAAEANKPAGYTGANKSAADEALKKIQNREEFKYDVNNDVLYQQYKDQAMRQGKLAMEDTIGKASALTGGYGNSYAATAGNQAFQMYLDRLNDRIPELYSAAYSKYQQERQNDIDNYKLLAALDEQEYDRANDNYSKWASETDRAYGRYNDAFDRGYKANSEAQNYLYDIALQNEKSRLEDEATAAKKYQADLDYQLGLQKLYAKEAEDAAEAEAAAGAEREAAVNGFIDTMIFGGEIPDNVTKQVWRVADSGTDGYEKALDILSTYYGSVTNLKNAAATYGITNKQVDKYLESHKLASKDLATAFSKLEEYLKQYDITEEEAQRYYDALFNYFSKEQIEAFLNGGKNNRKTTGLGSARYDPNSKTVMLR